MNKSFFLDGETLSLSDLSRLAEGGVSLDLTETAWARIAEGRAIVDQASGDGSDYYGLNTGVGSQKDYAVESDDFATFNAHIIIAEATVMPGPCFAPDVVRGALVVLLNNAATGRLGMRPQLVERMLRLYQSDEMPEVRRNTSSGMADLGPLAQLALPLVGHCLSGGKPLIEGPYDLAAKEAVSLINCNAFSIAHAAQVLGECEGLLAAFDWAAALSFEGFRANIAHYAPSKQAGLRNPYQIRSANRIANALEGAKLWERGEARFLQDALSFRFASRIHGAALSALEQARAVYHDDLNCVCDNPVVSLEDKSIVTGINMDSTPLTAVTDMLRQTLAMASAASTERSLKMQDPTVSGLPTGLAQPGHADGGVQNLIISYLSVTRQAELRGLAAPVLLDCAHALADGIEDISGLAPLSVQRTEDVVTLCWQIVSVEMVIAVWAASLRGLKVEDMGAGTREICQMLQPHLPIGSEGRQVFDLGPLVSLVRRFFT